MMDHVGKTNTKQKHVVKAKSKKQKGISEMITKLVREWCHDKKVLRSKVKPTV